MWPQHQQQYMRGIPPQLSQPAHHSNSHAQQPQAHVPNNPGMMDLSMPSNPRASRNMAEKQRRDNLNTNISTMATLVPTVAGSSRRMDKISILRLAAAYLRTQYTLGPGTAGFLPPYLNDFDLEQYIIENMAGNGGFFIVLTTTGKIVYISRHVEQQLGHAQTELLGQSLYNFVCEEDHEELTRNLTPDGMQASASSVTHVVDDSSNSSDGPGSSRPNRMFEDQRRSFNIRMSQRAVSRREHTQYESLHLCGQLRLADACTNQEANANRSRHREINTLSNDIVLVGIARLMKKRTITELSLLEATKDEYVTRHLVDGRIIFCDHRISVVAGYMSEEVSGLSAFKFMHKDDVRWTMIGLRQMYDRGEGFGSSCYRLLSKTGQFIYLRTHGYLEFDKTTQTVESFVCINTLVSEEEGEELVKEMKSRFSATISGTAKAMITDSENMPQSMAPEVDRQDPKATVEDPLQLEDAITHLISDLPTPAILEKRLSPSPLPNGQYVKAALYSQRLPPISIQAGKFGMKKLESIKPLVANVVPNGKIEVVKVKGTSVSPEKLLPNGKLQSINSTVAGPSFAKSGKPIGALSPAQTMVLGSSVPRKEITRVNNVRLSPEKILLNPSQETPREGIIFDGSRSVLENMLPRLEVSHTVPEKRIPEEEVSQASPKDSVPRETINEQNIEELSTIIQGNHVPKIHEIVTSSSEVIRRLSVVREHRPAGRTIRIVKISDPTLNNHRGKTESMLEYSTSETNGFASRTCHPVKRTRSSDDLALTCKRKSNVNSVPEQVLPAEPLEDQGTESTNVNLLPVASFVASTPMLEDSELLSPVSPGDVLRLSSLQSKVLASIDLSSPMEGYQQLNSRSSDISIADEQLDDFQDLQGVILSPSLDGNADIMKMFDDLRPVMGLERTIDEAQIEQFAANDVVNEGIRRTHLHLANTMAMRETQFNVIQQDLDIEVTKPAFHANLNQLQEEHNKEKQILKTLQQDYHNLQVNVNHNIDV